MTGIVITSGITITQGIFIGGGIIPASYFITEYTDIPDSAYNLITEQGVEFIEEKQ